MEKLLDSIVSNRNFNDLNLLNKYCMQENQEALSLLGKVWCELIQLGFLKKSENDSETMILLRKNLKQKLDVSLQICMDFIEKSRNLQVQKLAFSSSIQILEKLQKFQEIFKLIISAKSLKFLDHVFEIMTLDMKRHFYKFLKEILDQLLENTWNVEGIRKKRKILENENVDKKIILENSFHLLKNQVKEDCKEKVLKRVYSDAWLAFLGHAMDNKTLKKVLIELDSVIPYLQDPRLLSDFYIDSYNQGGVFGILALNGLFTLITKYDLEYSNFYEKLYQLLVPSVFHTKFKSRFFNLVSLFLSSSLLPVNLIAGFIKKLVRLACFAPPSGITIILPIIYNLLRSHHKCISMIHKTGKDQSIETKETFDFLENDPTKSGALDSSLWELATLNRHYHFQIKDQISKFSSPLLSNQKVADFLYETYDSFASKTIASEAEISVQVNLEDVIF